ncbi:hypothetical protein CJU90_4271 [Yarrowia sp. C11]|nr:hypothetical protein CJU90_4271 [Yarrowia sp. C11]
MSGQITTSVEPVTNLSDPSNPSLDIPGALTYLKIQINRLGTLARGYNVLHLQYDQMPEPARTELATIARKILISGQHLVKQLGLEHPLTQELTNMIHMVGQRVTGEVVNEVVEE